MNTYDNKCTKRSQHFTRIELYNYEKKVVLYILKKIYNFTWKRSSIKIKMLHAAFKMFRDE